jgi:hypothetical protein
MKKRIVIGCGVTFSIFILLLMGLWIYLSYLDKWYDQVQSELPPIKQKIIVLNRQVVDQLPNPEGTTETEYHDWGLGSDNDYGILTCVVYAIIDPNLNIQLWHGSNLIDSLII